MPQLCIFLVWNNVENEGGAAPPRRNAQAWISASCVRDAIEFCIPVKPITHVVALLSDVSEFLGLVVMRCLFTRRLSLPLPGLLARVTGTEPIGVVAPRAAALPGGL